MSKESESLLEEGAKNSMLYLPVVLLIMLIMAEKRIEGLKRTKYQVQTILSSS